MYKMLTIQSRRPTTPRASCRFRASDARRASLSNSGLVTPLWPISCCILILQLQYTSPPRPQSNKIFEMVRHLDRGRYAPSSSQHMPVSLPHVLSSSRRRITIFVINFHSKWLVSTKPCKDHDSIECIYIIFQFLPCHRPSYFPFATQSSSFTVSALTSNTPETIHELLGLHPQARLSQM